LSAVSSRNETSTEDGLLTRKLVHLALPVRWSLVGREGRATPEMACTYDIHPQGARLLSGREMTVGDMVMIERGRNKAICQVIWSADPGSALRGQFTVQCIEGRAPWEDELRQMKESFDPVLFGGPPRASSSATGSPTALSHPEVNRRRRPRFDVKGHAEVSDGMQHLVGELEQISECGARLLTGDPLRPGTDFRLLLSVFDVSLSLKAQVKYLVNDLGMGVEFHEIRRGDRPLLSYILDKVRMRRVEDFARETPEPQPAV
jgi:PilZ domain